MGAVFQKERDMGGIILIVVVVVAGAGYLLWRRTQTSQTQ